MADEYKVPKSFGEAEFTERRSRFIGRVWPVQDADEAVSKIRLMREKHWDATHNVYAYVLREGSLSRHSDDGEPSGTAGMPVLDVLLKAGVLNVCCVVTRYFGGVLLGAGGLVRAYAKSAKLALESAGVATVGLWKEFSLSCPYNILEKIRAQLEILGGAELEAEFGAMVRIRAVLPEAGWAELGSRVMDISSGEVMPEYIGEVYR